MKKNTQSFTDYSKSLKEANQFWHDEKNIKLTVAYGNSDFFLLKAIDAFRATFINNEDTHYSSVEGSSISLESFRELWQNQGMFDPISAYSIRRTEKFKALASALKLIKSPNQVKNKILLVINTSKLQNNLIKEFDRLDSIYIPCFQPNLKDFPKIVKILCENNKLLTTPDGQALLYHCIGDDLFGLENEILKLKLISGDHKQPLTAKEIAQYLGIIREDHAFKLTNLLLEQKYAEAQILASNLIAKGESTIAILGVISRHIRNTLQIGAHLRYGMQQASSSQISKLPKFVISSYQQYAKKIDLKKMARALSLCQKADVRLKTSKYSHDELIIGELISAISL
ncbi:MAG: DNA polymerase III subunit delta [Bdellovibrionota bacterium]